MKKSNQQNKWTLLGFDSAEEWYFSEWCKEAGLRYQYKPTTYALSAPIKLLVTKPKSSAVVHLLHGCEYTPDFILVPSEPVVANIPVSMDVLVQPMESSLKTPLFLASGFVIVIDTKGSNFMGSSRSSDVRFPVIQKWMWKEYQIYVNSVIPEKLFERTFYPEVYFWSPTGKERTKKDVPFSQLYKRIGDI